jgi:hypothetical protein
MVWYYCIIATHLTMLLQVIKIADCRNALKKEAHAPFFVKNTYVCMYVCH